MKKLTLLALALVLGLASGNNSAFAMEKKIIEIESTKIETFSKALENIESSISTVENYDDVKTKFYDNCIILLNSLEKLNIKKKSNIKTLRNELANVMKKDKLTTYDMKNFTLNLKTEYDELTKALLHIALEKTEKNTLEKQNASVGKAKKICLFLFRTIIIIGIAIVLIAMLVGKCNPFENASIIVKEFSKCVTTKQSSKLVDHFLECVNISYEYRKTI